jgi:tol-pal system protein YbgF
MYGSVYPMKKTLIPVLVFSALASFSAPSHALFGDDEARKAILELRAQVQSQQDSQVALYDKIESLTAQVQQLRGELDELKNSFGKEQKKSQELLADLSSQNAKEAEAEAKKQAAQDKEILAQQEFNAAYKMFQGGKYDAAIRQFNEFGRKYPSSKLYPESLYWLATSQYAKGQYAQAIANGNKMASAYPKHAKASEALLTVGMAQLDSKKSNDAKATFAKIIKDYPKSAAAKYAKQQK